MLCNVYNKMKMKARQYNQIGFPISLLMLICVLLCKTASSMEFLTPEITEALTSFNQWMGGETNLQKQTKTMKQQFLDDLERIYRINFKKKTQANDFRQIKEESNERVKSKTAEIIEAERLLESRQYSEDPEVSKLMYQVYREQMMARVLPSDKRDIRTHQVLREKIPFVSSQKGKGGRYLREVEHPREEYREYEVRIIEEPYPESCQNNGKLVTQKQKYQMCKYTYEFEDDDEVKPHEWMRVTENTYRTLKTKFQLQFQCKEESRQTNACLCPKGYYDYQCATETYRVCFVNITNPPYYSRECESKPDTTYYKYSVGGYDPCYFFDFTKKYTLNFKLYCQVLDESGFIEPNIENIGYKYRDVLVHPQLTENLSKDGLEFHYAATNPQTRFSVTNPQKFKVSLQFQDMKWMTNQLQFSTEIDDPLVLAGLKEGNITVDLRKLELSDSNNDTRYVNGGRAYFEAEVLGFKISSFSARGFFDKLNYEEPIRDLSKPIYKEYLWQIIISALVLAVLLKYIRDGNQQKELDLLIKQAKKEGSQSRRKEHIE